MSFDELYELLVHRNRVLKPIDEEEGLRMMRRLHELLDESDAGQKDEASQSATFENQYSARDSKAH